ncbi:unnamed protein product [Lota lota]
MTSFLALTLATPTSSGGGVGVASCSQWEPVLWADRILLHVAEKQRQSSFLIFKVNTLLQACLTVPVTSRSVQASDTRSSLTSIPLQLCQWELLSIRGRILWLISLVRPPTCSSLRFARNFSLALDG